MHCSCVIVNYADVERTINLAKSLLPFDQVARVVVVDNCSPDDSWDRLQVLAGENKMVLVRSDRNGGYGAGNNVGIRHCLANPLEDGRQLVCILNPDTTIDEASLAESVECFNQHPNAIVAAPVEYDFNTGERYADTAWQVPSAGTYICQFLAIFGRINKIRGYSFDEMDSQRFFPVGCVSGALLMLDAEKFREIGLYDEKVFLLCEETSLGVRSQGRFESYVCTKARYTHEFSTSMRASLPNFRKRQGILSRSRLRVLEADYKVCGLQKALAHLCYGISFIEAFPLAWAYNVLCHYREKKESQS